MKIPAYLIGALTGPTASLTKDVASAVWETALDENVLGKVPVASVVLAVRQGAAAISDRLYATKVVQFLNVVENLSVSERVRVVDELAGTEAKRERLGELLLDKLDRADPLHKPKMLADLFVAVGRRKIPASDFERLSDMVLSVFLSDLRDLAERGNIEDVTESRRFALQASGFLAWEIEDVYAGGGASLKWSITADGSTILANCPLGSD
ncbi:hypothetical protein [Xanthomonas oryzae]|uniref:hypothetical protein n=1 Tax=Xanthomonas oryzae TaxID=347 RepID=UPI0000678CB8|nr:hypothetical protein [Xanthomonas oryzae]AJQ85629.1 hypothetical protein AZ54_19345 [Xanthomonas oryzae pv. oryzae PXO86]ALZ73128.1 hypothetical protein APZ20_18170 [Xanthomonas oryzae pv. oryzae]AOS07756.1 hypothetical protein ATY43_18985 [Xanthomonas oryzae pv. oryzae]AOS11934.1 hypothetical protein ATY44_18325 [Xanthomonas oryzae pv. oryzae]AOS16109.1 hypothetical protein ATY45_17990 [Xanthomonas oryzae pv. oryzae]